MNVVPVEVADVDPATVYVSGSDGDPAEIPWTWNVVGLFTGVTIGMFTLGKTLRNGFSVGPGSGRVVRWSP